MVEMIINAIHQEVWAKTSNLSTDCKDTPFNCHVMSKWNLNMTIHTEKPLTSQWIKPHEDHISLHCDGLVTTMRTGNGGLFWDSTSTIIVAYSSLSESKHVLWNECYALLKGLEIAV